MFDQLSEKMSQAFKHLSGNSQITEKNIQDALSEVRTALLEADVNFVVVKNFLQEVKEKALGVKVISGVNPGEQFIKIVHNQLQELMGNQEHRISWQVKEPAQLKVIFVVGLNGQGKTTFCGKLAKWVSNKEKKKTILIPADTFRPAAKKQLEVLAEKAGVTCFPSQMDQDPENLVRQALEQVCDEYEVAIVDTAGRLQVDEELMKQVQRVCQVGEDKRFESEVLLVSDAMLGQSAADVAQVFHKSLKLTGLVLSKMDSDARGGAALSLRALTGVPICFLSNGEKLESLDVFYPERLASRILDMGDILSLVEKAQEVVDEKAEERMKASFEKNRFTLEDFYQQMKMLQKMGPLASIMKMMPGTGGLMREMGDMGSMEQELKSIRVIIDSMTPKERNTHHIINRSRIQRISRGCGKTEKDVQDFLKKFEKMEKMMKTMMRMFKTDASSASSPEDVMSQMLSGQFPGSGSQKSVTPKKSASSKGKGGPWGRFF